MAEGKGWCPTFHFRRSEGGAESESAENAWTQVFDAISRSEEGDMAHPILPQDMPDDEDHHCETNKRRKLRYSLSAWLSCFHLIRSWPVAQRKS